MENQEEIKTILGGAKTICLIPAQDGNPESLAATLALFYTLKESGKNVNVILGSFPETLHFLVPSLDALTVPKNVVISIPKQAADISQVYYEKNEEQLKIHLTVERGQLKKDAIAFYFEEPKPDVIISIGIQNFQQALAEKLDSFGYLLDTPIINVDNNAENVRFGRTNIVEPKSLAEIAMAISPTPIQKSAANCLLAGLLLYYQNFKSQKMTPEIFTLVAQLITQGAEYGTMVENLWTKS